MNEELNRSGPMKENSGSQHRRRRVWERVVYPTSPIVLDKERVAVGNALLAEVAGKWEKGEHLNALLRWFGSESVQRNDAVDDVLLRNFADSSYSLRSMQDLVKGTPDFFILKRYLLVTTDAVRKILLPSDDDPITGKDVDQISRYNEAERPFEKRVRSLGVVKAPFHDADDFTEPRSEIVTNFNLEEERQFLLRLIPHTQGRVKKELLSSWGVVGGVVHADLLSDPILADHVERAILKEIHWADYLSNYLAKGVFPLASTFEEAFRRLDPKDSDPLAIAELSEKDVRDTKVPMSALYFSLLRKMVSRESASIYGVGREERIVAYLQNESFMAHVLPYLATDAAYRDDLIAENDRYMFIHSTPLARGEEAKRLKRVQLCDVVKAAIDYANLKGNSDVSARLVQQYSQFCSP